nr:putative potassium transporter 16 [Quercus suber]
MLHSSSHDHDMENPHTSHSFLHSYYWQCRASLSSVLFKFDQGGYLPLAFATVLMTVMYTWNIVFRKKYHYELEHKISPENLKEIVAKPILCRILGLALFYSELVQGIPPIFKNYVVNVPALHFVLVFISVKSLPISKVPVKECFRFRPKELNIFRCIVRYGYTDVQNEQEPFEKVLIENLKLYIRENFWLSKKVLNNNVENSGDTLDGRPVEEDMQSEEFEREIETLDKPTRHGMPVLFTSLVKLKWLLEKELVLEREF